MMSMRRVIVGSLLIGLALLFGSFLHVFGQTTSSKGRRSGTPASQNKIVYDRMHRVPAGIYWQVPLYVPPELLFDE